MSETDIQINPREQAMTDPVINATPANPPRAVDPDAMFEPIQLGDRVKDTITGLTGIATVISTWLNGCIRIGVQPEKLEGGKFPEIQNFDQAQLRVVKRGVHKPVIFAAVEAPAASTRRSSGGPAREGAGFIRP